MSDTKMKKNLKLAPTHVAPEPNQGTDFTRQQTQTPTHVVNIQSLQAVHAQNVDRLQKLQNIIAVQNSFQEIQNRHHQLLDTQQSQIATLHNDNIETKETWNRIISASNDDICELRNEITSFKKQLKNFGSQLEKFVTEFENSQQKQEDFQIHQIKEMTKIKDILIDLMHPRSGHGQPIGGNLRSNEFLPTSLGSNSRSEFQPAPQKSGSGLKLEKSSSQHKIVSAPSSPPGSPRTRRSDEAHKRDQDSHTKKITRHNSDNKAKFKKKDRIDSVSKKFNIPEWTSNGNSHGHNHSSAPVATVGISKKFSNNIPSSIGGAANRAHSNTGEVTDGNDLPSPRDFLGSLLGSPLSNKGIDIPIRKSSKRDVKFESAPSSLSNGYDSAFRSSDTEVIHDYNPFPIVDAFSTESFQKSEDCIPDKPERPNWFTSSSPLPSTTNSSISSIPSKLSNVPTDSVQSPNYFFPLPK